MKRYEMQAPTGPDGWVLTEQDEPKPGPGEILVRVRAVSLNYRDLITAQNPKQRIPLVPCSDGAGEVAAIGSDVTRVQPGDRVAGIFFQNWLDGPIEAVAHASAMGGAVDGMLSEYVVLSEDGVVKLPDYLTWEEAAALPCAAVTVWNALFEQAHLTAGETVLLLGTGGVSIFALQFARTVGARVIITSSSDAKLTQAREMGAAETINYKTTPDWEKSVWNLTGKQGVDYVVEVGGAGTLEKSMASTRYGGYVAVIGVLTGFAIKIDPMPILGKSLQVQGVYVGSRAMFERMLTAMTQNDIHPIIDRVFPFTEAPEALHHMQSGSHFGKIVITV